ASLRCLTGGHLTIKLTNTSSPLAANRLVPFLSRFCCCCDHYIRSSRAEKKSMQQQDECFPSESLAARLYTRYAASIFAYARLHTSSWEDAEDLTLEVFTAALEQNSLSWLTEKQQFVWLRRVA